MQKSALSGLLLLMLFAASISAKPAMAIDTLTPNDFQSQSFSKTVDFFDYARAYAVNADKPVPPANWHAYLYQVYINVSGFQLCYSGLSNITTGEGSLTTPVQNVLEHYKTPGGKDVLTSSSFLMLLAFNDTATSLYKDSPDRNDDLYASYTLGYDLGSIFNSSRPSLNSETTLIPLTHSDDYMTWEWGMRYSNLTALWWRMSIDPEKPGFNNSPVAITTYEELTFNYKLILNSTTKTATLTTSYIIGRMTNLWLFDWPRIILTHYNSTGEYRLGKQISSENIYQYLESQHIKMSIVLFQNSLALGYVTNSTFENQNVTDSDVDVSKGAITTDAGNEKIFEADFGTKSQYTLFNYTAGNAEMGPYDAITRTAPRFGFARNSIFAIQVAFLKYVPLVVAHMDPQLYQAAKDHLLNMTYADCFYIISYPEYYGFTVEHDPTFTAYLASASPPVNPPGSPNLSGPVIVGAAVALVAIGVMIVLRRRRAS